MSETKKQEWPILKVTIFSQSKIISNKLYTNVSRLQKLFAKLNFKVCHLKKIKIKVFRLKSVDEFFAKLISPATVKQAAAVPWP